MLRRWARESSVPGGSGDGVGGERFEGRSDSRWRRMVEFWSEELWIEEMLARRPRVLLARTPMWSWLLGAFRIASHRHSM